MPERVAPGWRYFVVNNGRPKGLRVDREDDILRPKTPTAEMPEPVRIAEPRVIPKESLSALPDGSIVARRGGRESQLFYFSSRAVAKPLEPWETELINSLRERFRVVCLPRHVEDGSIYASLGLRSRVDILDGVTATPSSQHSDILGLRQAMTEIRSSWKSVDAGSVGFFRDIFEATVKAVRKS